MATHGTTDQSGASIGSRSLDWNTATTGLYEKSWQGIPQLSQGNTLTATAALTITDLIQLRKWENPRIRFYTNEGEATGIVKQVSINVTHSGLGLADIIIIKQQ